MIKAPIEPAAMYDDPAVGGAEVVEVPTKSKLVRWGCSRESW